MQKEENISNKSALEKEIELIKLEKLILMMCFEATNFSRLMIDHKIVNNFNEILTWVKNLKISECNILNQSSLNFEVLIDLIKLTTEKLLKPNEINNFLNQLLNKESSDLEESHRKSDRLFVRIFHARETISKHISFLK